MNLRALRGRIPDAFYQDSMDFFGNRRHLGCHLFRPRILPEVDIKMRGLHGEHSCSRRPAGYGQEEAKQEKADENRLQPLPKGFHKIYSLAHQPVNPGLPRPRSLPPSLYRGSCSPGEDPAVYFKLFHPVAAAVRVFHLNPEGFPRQTLVTSKPSHSAGMQGSTTRPS